MGTLNSELTTLGSKNQECGKMRIICEVCKQEGYLQQLGNYYRIRHYIGKGESGKGKFSYHQQNKEWVQNQLSNKDSTDDQLNTTAGQNSLLSVQNASQGDCNNLKLSLDNGNTHKIECGRRLVWFRTLAFQANDPGFKSRRPHLNRTIIQVRIPARPQLQKGVDFFLK